MRLSVEEQKELDLFPGVLRALVNAELAAGNTLIEIGHTFPAPPCGAYFKLANKITTRPRASGDGIDFYARNNSSYSGEFTDAKRIHFVLEAPDPPPPEPDMDAIRRAHDPGPDSLTRLGQTRETAPSRDSTRTARPRRLAPRGSTPPRLDELQPPVTETETGWTRVLVFRDKRLPHEVLFELERNVMTLFAPAVENGLARWLGDTSVNGLHYRLELRFDAAVILNNYYSLHVTVTWPAQPAGNQDYYRKSSGGWLSLWTRDLVLSEPLPPGRGSAAHYAKRCTQALEAEKHLDSVAAIQRAIITGIQKGGTYGDSHKEGGTTIRWHGDRFLRSDYGDYPDTQTYTDETAFLTMLKQFCHRNLCRNAFNSALSDFDTWKLILRCLSTD